MSFPTGRFVVVTGTDTGVGKTIVTAALVVLLEDQGLRVAVVKAAQTGLEPGERGDIDDVIRLTGTERAQELTRLRLPLAPESAARIEGRELLTVDEIAGRVRSVDADVVIIEGAGGVLVRLDLAGGTVIDLALALGAEVVVVAGEGLGTLNHTGLTIDRLRAAGIEPRLVLGSCDRRRPPTQLSNHHDLPRLTGRPIEGRVPAGAGTLDRTDFCREAAGWFRMEER